MKAKVTVRLKSGVLDPQGQAVLHAANSLGFDGLKDVRLGKVFEIELDSAVGNENKILEALESLSEKLLANTVIENFEVEMIK